jgi:hypothetical protein
LIFAKKVIFIQQYELVWQKFMGGSVGVKLLMSDVGSIFIILVSHLSRVGVANIYGGWHGSPIVDERCWKHLHYFREPPLKQKAVFR